MRRGRCQCSLVAARATGVRVSHVCRLVAIIGCAVADEGWQGNTACWSSAFTFEYCCNVDPVSQLAQAPGRADCWDDIWHFDSCQCLEPQDCEGGWSQCTSDCTKQFSVSEAAANGGTDCTAADGDISACFVGEGACPSSGRSCNGTSVVGLVHGYGGNCDGRNEMPHGEECEVTCDSGYGFVGIQPRCFDGELLFTGGCQWEGDGRCWNNTYTFERCCTPQNGTAVPPGDESCWETENSRSFESCQCMEPRGEVLALPPTSNQVVVLFAATLFMVCAVVIVLTKRRNRVIVVNEQGELVGELQAKINSLEKQMLQQMVAQCVDKAEASMKQHQQSELEALQA